MTMKNTTDEELVERYKKGEAEAFEELYLRYNKLINAFARSYFLVGGDEDDIKQEAMLGLVGAIMTFDESKGKFGTFAYMCIKSRVLNAVNAALGEKHKSLNDAVPISNLEFEAVEPNLLPENEVIISENMRELVDNIKSVLSDFEIAVFEKYFLQGQNYREIASSLNVSNKKVDNAIQRVKVKTRKLGSKLWHI